MDVLLGTNVLLALLDSSSPEHRCATSAIRKLGESSRVLAKWAGAVGGGGRAELGGVEGKTEGPAVLSQQ